MRVTSAISSGSGDLALSAVFAVVFAVFGYRLSVRNQTLRGVTPWRFPSFMWAVICFALGPFGIIVELLAEFTTRPRLPATDGGAAVAYHQAEPPRDTVAYISGTTIEPAAPRMPPPPGDETGKSPLFGWYADTSGRHEKRYWDGKRWSDLVSDGGVTTHDPV